jgi:hypothetical protein
MKVFISYKWEDPDHNVWVERLASDLRARGIEALLDKWEVRYGESFSDYMTRGINTADVVLFIMTPKSIGAAEAAASGGGAVKFEVQLATARRLAGEAFRFIGILRRGDRPPAHLRDFRYADFRDEAAYEASLRHLIADLRGSTERPPVVTEPSHELRLAEWTSVGQELGMSSLRGEFLSGTHDVVVWEDSMDGPASPIGVFRAKAKSYSYTSVESIPFATRIRSGPDGWIIATQERRGVHVIDLTGSRPSRFLPIEAVGEPIIRSEAQHHVLPLLALGTDYGKVVLWDWSQDEVVFEKRYFPRESIVWISALAFRSSGEELVFCVNNSLLCVRTKDGEKTSEQQLGFEEETVCVAVNCQSGAVAVGGIMDTKVYTSIQEPSLIYQVRNSVPMVEDLRFSPDGSLLGIVDGGGLGGSGVIVVESTRGDSIQRFAQIWPTSKKGPTTRLFASGRSVSFSETGGLVAVGEGGRVGIYRRSG